MQKMDMDEFRVVLGSTGVDVWSFIDTAIAVASMDYGDEMKDHRDRIVERLYASSAPRCRNCDADGRRLGDGDTKAAFSVDKETSHHLNDKRCSPSTPQSFDGDDEKEDHRNQEIDEEQTRILAIKEHLEDPDQSEESLVELLQTLADMDITFKALKESDIGRHVNRLRKHPSNDVRRLVKHLVRNWKDLVDEWMKLNTSGYQLVSPALIADGDSPQQKLSQNGHHQVPDFAYSPIPHNGSSGSEKNNGDTELNSKVLPLPLPRKETPAKPAQTPPSFASVPHNKQREQREDIDLERLASARKRLHQNYQDAENAKKQRTIRVMDIHEIPKPKNGFFAKNKGGGGGGGVHHHGRHW